MVTWGGKLTVKRKVSELNPRQTYDALGEILNDLPDTGMVQAEKKILERARELHDAWERKDASEFFHSLPSLEGASFAYDRVVTDLFTGHIQQPRIKDGCPHTERVVLESDDGSILRLLCRACGEMMECDHEHTDRIKKFNGGNPVLLCELCRVIVSPA